MDWRQMFAVLAVMGASAAPARAHERDSRPVLLTFDSGVCLVHRYAPNSPLLLPHLGGTLQFDLSGPLAANVFVGIGGCLTAAAGGTIRYAGNWSGATRLTAGVGPMIANVLGDTTALAEADVALEIRSRSGFAFVVGPKLMVALTPGGGEICAIARPTDCVAERPVGTYSVLFRVGLGASL